MNSTDEDIKYWISLYKIPGIGKIKIAKLIEYFGNLKDAWTANINELARAGLDTISVSNISKYRSGIDPEIEFNRLKQYEIEVIPYISAKYPKKLLEIPDFPAIIFTKGQLMAEDEISIAVVGSRKSTSYGRQVIEDIVADLCKNGITIVSGLARGIDTIAHRVALDCGGRTIAVFASGLDIVYPFENRALVSRIIKNGAIVSEFPPGIKPKPEYFPLRNRIMSGLSLGVLVIEAGEKSGALITAEYSLNNNREVFAIPGSIYSPYSKGTNKLIQQGAKLVTNYLDIIEELNLPQLKKNSINVNMQILTKEESSILNILNHQPLHIDDICRQCNLSSKTVISTLAILELKGLAQQIGTLNYVKSKEIE